MPADAGTETDELTRSIATRLQAVHWEDYDSRRASVRDEAHHEVEEIREALSKIADTDPELALKIWDENVPDAFKERADRTDIDPPSEENSIEPGKRRRKRDDTLTADDLSGRGEAEPSTASSTAPSLEKEAPKKDLPRHKDNATTSEHEADGDERRIERRRMLEEGLAKRYHIAGDVYHHRAGRKDVAFEAAGKRITTRMEDAEVIRSMLDLAETRGWSGLKLSGTSGFRREAWLEASLRGMGVSGYTPDKLDLARLAEHQAERAQPGAKVEDPQPRTPSSGSSAPLDRRENGSGDEPRLELSRSQKAIVRALEKIMIDRGDSSEAINLARELAAERFLSNRVYVGRLVETGSTPYQDRAGERPGPYVTLEDDDGRRSKIWGVDLPRALEAAEAKEGDKVVVAFGGRKAVSVERSIRDEKGAVMGLEKADVMRNTWEIARFDRLREDAKAQIVNAVKSAVAPMILGSNVTSAVGKGTGPTDAHGSGAQRGRERAG